MFQHHRIILSAKTKLQLSVSCQFLNICMYCFTTNLFECHCTLGATESRTRKRNIVYIGLQFCLVHIDFLTNTLLNNCSVLFFICVCKFKLNPILMNADRCIWKKRKAIHILKLKRTICMNFHSVSYFAENVYGKFKTTCTHAIKLIPVLCNSFGTCYVGT